jgi:hypothetical protein
VIPLLWAATAAAVVATLWAVVHLTHLPVAPRCPDCRATTRENAATTTLDRLFGEVGHASARECTRCGWAGRMRWRLAVRRTAGE